MVGVSIGAAILFGWMELALFAIFANSARQANDTPTRNANGASEW